MRNRPKPATLKLEDQPMADLIALVLGTGGILLMGVYAVLCHRI